MTEVSDNMNDTMISESRNIVTITIAAPTTWTQQIQNRATLPRESASSLVPASILQYRRRRSGLSNDPKIDETTKTLPNSPDIPDSAPPAGPARHRPADVAQPHTPSGAGAGPSPHIPAAPPRASARCFCRAPPPVAARGVALAWWRDGMLSCLKLIHVRL